MSEHLKLTFAAGSYDFVQPLIDGTVKADGIDLTILTAMGSGERHWRMGHRQEFDLCELNIAAYLAARDAGRPLAALPVFLHRRFRHGFLFVNPAAGITEPRQLVGKRIGGPTFTAAGNVWMRGILEDRHDLPHREVTWAVEREDAVLHDRQDGARIERLPPGQKAEDLLLDGRLDAVLHPDLPSAYLRGDPRIVRLFEDSKAYEMSYFRETGIFPIMHVTAIRQEIVEQYPWVVLNLRKAFDAAKQIAYQRIKNPRNVALAWVRDGLEEQMKILGTDPWEYGLTVKNRHTLETIRGYAFRQGIIRRELPLDELFVDDTMIDIPEGI